MAALYAKSTSRTLINFVISMWLLCLTTTLTAATTTKSTPTKPRRFVIKLIHHDYALSPYYNHNSTITDRAISMMKRSMARLTYLEAKAHYFTDDDIRVGLVPRNTAEFMANISIREPQDPQLISIDSGSNVVWVQYLPCTKCFEQTSPIFYPSKSSTYTQFPVILILRATPAFVFGRGTGCRKGPEGLQLLFNMVDSIVDCQKGWLQGWSCSYYGKASGILGLGPLKISLANQIRSKFSHCIGSIRDLNYPHNQLVLGDGVMIEGSSTPLIPYDDIYYLLDGKFEKVESHYIPSALCYKGNISQDLTGFPVVSFFLDHAEGEFCMAVQVPPDDFNIVGIMAQQQYNVAYDLAASKLYFQRIDCDLDD
ncbi:unnamed protein product [Malus baccata var. baccata]